MIGTYLDLSVAHFENETLEALYDGLLDIVSYPKYDKEIDETVGAFVHVPDDIEGFDLPKDLKRVLRYAQKKGCYWVQIDRDADIITELSIYGEVA